MASYYSGNSEIQGGDGLQTLVLMNPGNVNYSDHHQQPPHPPAGNFMFLNNHQHTSQPQQLVGIPLSSQPSNSLHSQHDITFMPRAPYTMYNPMELAAVRPQEVNGFQQGLSLTLSSQQPGFGTQAAGAPTVSSNAEGVVAGSTPSASGNSNGGNGSMQSVLLNSKYLKVTQELLEEVVNVGKERVFKNSDQSTKNHSGSQAQTSGDETNSKRVDGVELTSAERQEVQMKKAKLVNMLDEVEQRYRQYHKQMQIVICWFEQASGIGSAKAYTALALETISKQFRCLKEAIMGQIKSASRNLGEEEGGGSRLKFVDNQIRQQRALQQLGMIQNNAWRPQRGLPERSVSVLRAWLFEHFLHPYPKDSDKHMLAKQTGLTRSQVSNWFINARVRLWKPMVEEMYLEEIKEQERQRNGFDENKASKSEQSEENENSPSKQENSKSFSPENIAKRNFNHPPPQSMSVSTTGINFQNHSLSSQMEGITQFNAKKPRTNVDFMGNPTDFMGGLGGYPIGEIERYGDHQFQSSYSGNGVSLTLGLPNESIRGMELGEPNEFEPMNQQSSSHSTAIYETINIQNQKRFAAQPLPDFVT